jgi:hypothetical protein
MRPLLPGRVRCCVPGCGRTFKEGDYSEIVCGKHWRLGDQRLRRLHCRIRRKAKKHVGWTPQLVRLEYRVWQKLRDQIIERSMGI